VDSRRLARQPHTLSRASETPRMRAPTSCGWIDREVLLSPIVARGGLERFAGGYGLTVRILGRVGTSRRLDERALGVVQRGSGTITALLVCVLLGGRASRGPAGGLLVATQPLQTSSVFAL
jgi:hypothetical protein